MKGIVVRLEKNLGVGFSITTSNTYSYISLPLHPYESTEGLSLGKEVEFDIQKFWETGIEKPIDVAVVVPVDDEIDEDFLKSESLKKLVHDNPNDSDLGELIRKKFNNYG